MKIVGGMTYLKEQVNKKIINTPQFIDVILTEVDRFEEADAKKRNLVITGKPLNNITYGSSKKIAAEIQEMMKETKRQSVGIPSAENIYKIKEEIKFED